DVAGSTSLGESIDPEALRAILARYFERMKGIVERHGGTVEKFIGDTVMAVFDVPVVHEDDALRALRAAVGMREAFPELGIERRLLRQAVDRAVEDRACQLFTMLGPAGFGKSRLVQEVLGSLEDEATIVVGRCLSYGEGITCWPLLEVLEQLGRELEIGAPEE